MDASRKGNYNGVDAVLQNKLARVCAIVGIEAFAEVAPLVEQAMHEEVMELLLAWLKQARHVEIHRLVPLERSLAWSELTPS